MTHQQCHMIIAIIVHVADTIWYMSHGRYHLVCLYNYVDCSYCFFLVCVLVTLCASLGLFCRSLITAILCMMSHDSRNNRICRQRERWGIMITVTGMLSFFQSHSKSWCCHVYCASRFTSVFIIVTVEHTGKSAFNKLVEEQRRKKCVHESGF